MTGRGFLGVCFVASNSYNVRNVNSSGAMNWNNAYNGNRGARPLWWNTANEYAERPKAEDHNQRKAYPAAAVRARG